MTKSEADTADQTLRSIDAVWVIDMIGQTKVKRREKEIQRQWQTETDRDRDRDRDSLGTAAERDLPRIIKEIVCSEVSEIIAEVGDTVEC